MRGAFATADRLLDPTPNQRLSLPVRLRNSRRDDVGLVGECLSRFLLTRGGEAIGQATEIVAVIQVIRIGFSWSQHVAILELQLHCPRGGDQSKIVFGMLKIVLGGDRVVACMCVARQLEVSFRHMPRGAANSGVRAVRVI